MHSWACSLSVIVRPLTDYAIGAKENKTGANTERTSLMRWHCIVRGNHARQTYRAEQNAVSSRTSEELNYFESGVCRKVEGCVGVYARLIFEARRRGLHDGYDVGGMQALVMPVGYIDFG